MRKPFIIAAIGLIVYCAGLAAAQSKAELSLKKERNNLEHTSDPVLRTKTGIKISELLITLLMDAARAGDDNLVGTRLTDYSATIQNAQQTIMSTGNDPHKHPAGFKELEIAMRKQQNLLRDLNRLVDFERRDDVDKARKLASDISDQLVKVMLLKDPNAPRKR